MKTKHPVYNMLFGVVTSNADIMPPFIYPHDLKLEATVSKHTQEKKKKKN